MLTELGLSADEETAYLALLAKARLTASQLGATVHWSHVRAERSLAGLADLDLVSASTDHPPRFAAIAPDVAVESLCQRRVQSAQSARKAIPELMQHFWSAQRDATDLDFIEIVASPLEGVRRVDQLQRAARKSVRGIDRPPYADNPSVLNTAELAGIPTGVEYRAIYDQSVVELPERWPDIEASIAAGEQARVFTNLPFKVTLYDDWGASMPVVNRAGEVTALMIVHRSPLLDALSALFESYWERAVPLSPEPASTPSRQDRLVTLLNAGMSDSAIQRTLAVSASTVQRDIRQLLDELGVSTRFQAGVQVGLRLAGAANEKPDTRQRTGAAT